MFKKTTLFPALLGLGLGLAAVPSHAQQPGVDYNQTLIRPDFSATLTDFGGGTGSPVNILAADVGDAPGTHYLAGTLGFNGGVFQIYNLTQNTLTPQLNFENLSLTETFVSGAVDSVTLYDVANIGSGVTPVPTTASDAFNFLADGNGNILDGQGLPIALTGNLYGTPATASGLQSVTLTGVFSDGATPAGQPIPVETAIVPEPAPVALLALCLLPLAALSLRSRRNL